MNEQKILTDFCQYIEQAIIARVNKIPGEYGVDVKSEFLTVVLSDSKINFSINFSPRNKFDSPSRLQTSIGSIIEGAIMDFSVGVARLDGLKRNDVFNLIDQSIQQDDGDISITIITT